MGDALAGGGVPTRALAQAAVHARTGVALGPRGGQRSRLLRADHDEQVVLRPDPLAAAASWDVVPRTCTRLGDTTPIAELAASEAALTLAASAALRRRPRHTDRTIRDIAEDLAEDLALTSASSSSAGGVQ